MTIDFQAEFGPDVEVEPYRWMFQWGRRDERDTPVDHRGWLFKDLREAYERLPETSGSVRMTELIGNDARGIYRICGQMLQYLGSWKLPKRFTQNQTRKWVNHKGVWAAKYTDAAVQCPCGAVKYYTENRMFGENYDQHHADDCTPINEHRAKMLMWQRRQAILRQAALNHQTKADVARRIGLTDESVGQHCKLLGIDYEGLQWHGYRTWRATMIAMQERFGLSRRELSEIFGKNRSTLREHINGNLRPYQDEETSMQYGVVVNDPVVADD